MKIERFDSKEIKGIEPNESAIDKKLKKFFQTKPFEHDESLAKSPETKSKHIDYDYLLRVKEDEAGIFAPFLSKKIDVPGAAEKDTDRGLDIAKELDGFEKEYMTPTQYVKHINGSVDGPNCYAFAIKKAWLDEDLKIPFRERPCPGYFSGNSFDSAVRAIIRGDSAAVKAEVLGLMRKDLATMGKEIEEVDVNYKCVGNEWKISISAGMIEGQPDIHFMREGEHSWYHKPGVTSVSCFDSDGKLITNPNTCKSPYSMRFGTFVIRDKK